MPKSAAGVSTVAAMRPAAIADSASGSPLMPTISVPGDTRLSACAASRAASATESDRPKIASTKRPRAQRRLELRVCALVAPGARDMLEHDCGVVAQRVAEA